MNENEIYEILNSYKQALDILLSRVEQLEQSVIDNKAELESKIKDVNDTLVEDVLNPASEARDWAAKEERFDGWLERNGEKFAPYADDYKLVEGEDKDLARDMFDTYEGMEGEDKPTEEEYVDSTIENLVAQINKIKEAFGAKDVEISTDENGEAEVKVDGEEVDTETVKEVVEGKEEISDEEEEATPDELAEFEKELEAYKG